MHDRREPTESEPQETTWELGDDPTPTVGSERPGGGDRASSELDESSVLRTGRQVGRYVVLGHLGSGGMGVVYAAYDPRLDRKIALKLLRPRPGGRDRALEARLLREAQALAKLSDPHVLTVYDVGTFGEQIFLAVEYVEGTNLAQWLSAEKRSQKEILDVFLQAGKGLAAAHRKGLVHRDFKPGNVMVRAADDSALVLDFGLVRSSAELEEPLDPSDRSTSLGRELTGFGAVLGTPAFMAPEQWQGRPATAATDQFSFCVSLYAALCGRLPFERQQGIAPPRSWAPASMPDAVALPARRRKALLRGLSVRQEERFPSMDALLKELAFDSRRRRRVWAAAGVAGIGLATLLLFRPATAKPCSAADSLFAEVWNPALKTELMRAFASTGKSYGVISARSVGNVLDDYAGDWSAGYLDACRATHVRKDQSPALLDRRMACLDQRRREAGALVGLFLENPSEVLDRSLRAVAALRSVEDCSDTAALTAPMDLPADPESRAEVDGIRDRLARNQANLAAGRYGEAFSQAQELVEETAGGPYLPLTAEALLHLGKAQGARAEGDSAFHSLSRAVAVAQAGNHDRVAAEAFVHLVRVAGHLQADFEAASFYAELAESSIARLDRGDRLKADLADHVGVLEVERGNPAAAVPKHLEALALNRARLGKDHPSVARSLIRLSTVLHDLGRFEDAERHLEEALEIQRAALGDRHPEVAAALDRLGNVLYRAGHPARALEHFEEALDILRAAHGNEHTRVATTTLHAASALDGLGRYERALAFYDEALKILVKSLGPDHPSVAAVWSNLGATRSSRRDFSGALEAYERALEIQEKALGAKHPNLALTYFNLGELRAELGDPKRAEQRHRQALELWRRALGEDHYLIGHGLTGLGRALLESGRPKEAAELFEQTLELWRDQQLDPSYPAWTHWMLARALQTTEPGRAVELAQGALPVFRDPPGADPYTAAEIEAWLEQMGVTAAQPN